MNTIPADGVLIKTTDHVHTGGGSTEFHPNRNGATNESDECVRPDRFGAEAGRLKRMRRSLTAKIARTRQRVRSLKRRTWETPSDLPPGTYTSFCRIHPVMRGAVRVKPAPEPPPSG